MLTRRTFTGAAAAFTIVPRHVLGAPFVPPSDKITIASIGMGRQGMLITMELLKKPQVQVVAVCDCNQSGKNYAEYQPNALLESARTLLGPGNEKWGEDLASPGEFQMTHAFRTSLGAGGRDPGKRLVDAYYRNQSCNAYSDYRELLEKQKDLDAIYIATPDHWHALIAIAAMRKKKHVLGQKPMAHTIAEARRMAQTAREMKVATALPVIDPTATFTQQVGGWISAGVIGNIQEVHNWSVRPFWPQGIERPKESQPVPAGLDWDMWLGPAPDRPFHSMYQPFSWRGWYDFGCGALGDMGCYSFSGIFKLLNLAQPLSAEASSTDVFEETYPQASMVHFQFPKLKLSWYDGFLHPPRPEVLPKGQQFGVGREGALYVGDKGIILGGFNGQLAQIYPESLRKEVRDITPDPAGNEPIDPWLKACKGGPPAATNFEAQLAVTETILLGNLAVRAKGDPVSLDTAPKNLIDPPYREKYSK